MKLSVCVFSALVAAGVGLSGCQADDPDEDLAAASQELGGTVSVPNLSGAYSMKVTANGLGCPNGTWGARLSADGRRLTVRFTSYEVIVDPRQSLAIKDCTLGVDLTGRSGLSFAVTALGHEGNALLDLPGTTATETIKQYFRGNPVSSKQLRAQLHGPYNATYVSAEQIEQRDRTWSPCAMTNRLNLQTRVVAQNNASKTGSIYVNVQTVDAETRDELHVGLDWKPCT